MSPHDFQREVQAAAEQTYAVMANESQSDDNEPFLTGFRFDEADHAALERAIDEGAPITGWLTWEGGFRSPFEAWYDGHVVRSKFGPWETMLEEA